MSNDWRRSFTIPVATRAPNNRLLGQRLSEYLFRNDTIVRGDQFLRAVIVGLWPRWKRAPPSACGLVSSGSGVAASIRCDLLQFGPIHWGA